MGTLKGEVSRTAFRNVFLIIILLSIGFLAIAAGLRYVDSQKVHVLVLGAGGKRGESYQMASAIAALARRHDPKLKIIVAETGGSNQNNRMLQEGHLQLATIQADTRAGADTRLVSMLYPDAFQLLVRTGRGIKSISDLRGKTIALPDKSSGQYRSFFFVARHFGLSEHDMHVVTMSSRAASWALSRGAVDATFRVRAPGNGELREIIRKGYVKLLAIPHARALRLDQPAVRQGVIPAGSYQGDPPVPETDLSAPAVQRLLVASRKAAPALIERVTRLIYENRRELADYTPLAGFLASPAQLSDSVLPLHDGARAYYERNAPSFMQQNAELLALYLTLIAGLASLLLRMRNRRQKARVDGYNRELIATYNEALADENASEEKYRDKMMEIFARVMKDAEEDNISSEGFEFLSFAWDELNDAIISAVREKRRDRRRRA